MEARRPGADTDKEPLPEWYVVAECMKAYHWTEKQFWEDNSLAMIFRLLFIEKVHAEKEEKERERAKGQQNAASNDAFGSGGMAKPRPRRAGARR